MFIDFLSYILFNHISKPYCKLQLCKNCKKNRQKLHSIILIYGSSFKPYLNFLIIKVSNSCNTRQKYNNGINANTAKT